MQDPLCGAARVTEVKIASDKKEWRCILAQGKDGLDSQDYLWLYTFIYPCQTVKTRKNKFELDPDIVES